MRSKGLLAAFLLGVGLCFVPALGQGEVNLPAFPTDPRDFQLIDLQLLKPRVDYIMRNPTSFLDVSFQYDPWGGYRKVMKLPESINTKDRICVRVYDNRGVFFYQSGIPLLDIFKRKLENIYSFIQLLATDMNTDIVAVFYSKGDIPLGYFYQGEYHLWGK